MEVIIRCLGSEKIIVNADVIIGDVQEATDQFMEAVEERIRFVVRKLREYVSDHKMQQILMKPIEVGLIKHCLEV